MPSNRALVIGVSDYPNPADRLPGVAGDVREIAKVLASRNGAFARQHVSVLTDAKVTRGAAMAALADAFASASRADTVFVYMAGHGSVSRTASGGSSYYYVTHDADALDLAGTAIDLAEVKRLFDACAAGNVFLWLDFCHSGGIIRRAFRPAGDDDQEAIRRVLQVVRGQGRLIFAACTPEQYAYESPSGDHGLFTASLLEGLRGAAAVAGEVTASSLHDYIDRTIGSARQRPMLFGQMTGRLVLMHFDGAGPPPAKGKALPPAGGAAAKQKPAAKAAKAGGAKGAASRGTDSSGDWCLLGGQFYRTQSVRADRDGNVAVEIPTRSGAEDAELSRLRPPRFGPPTVTTFAHLNEGFEARVEHVESTSAAGRQTWTIALRPQDGQQAYAAEMSYGAAGRHYSADDIARLRAGRILLNDPPAPPPDARPRFGAGGDSTLENLINGLGSRPGAVTCVPAAVFREHGETAEFPKLVRLRCVLELKVQKVAEQVLELVVGPLRKGRLHVRFRGRRARAASNVEPAIVEIEGDCPLT